MRRVVAMLIAFAWPAPEALPAAEPSAPSHAQRQDLVGTWRLLRIEIVAGGESHSDPFYGTHCSGLLIYDPSGAMSVQIVGAPRPSLPTPSVRRPGEDARLARREARLDSALLATYYAYFGTWDYDERRGLVTHHVDGSLYPAEAGLNYSQEVLLDGDRMTFTVRESAAAGESLHRKVWQRVRGANAPPP